MTELAQQGTMSSREIARITGKPHNDLMKAIREMEKAWERTTGKNFPIVNYQQIMGNGAVREFPEYQLNKMECLYIATKFNNEAKARLIIRWAELEEKAGSEKQEAIDYQEPLMLECPTKSYREQAKEKQRELMSIIRRYLKHGDIKDVARKIGKRYDTVKDVLNCHYKNAEIIQALYQRAMHNKESLLIDYDTMINELKKL